MSLVTSSNLDYLITPVRLYVGDLTGTTFSDSVILTALVSAVQYLLSRWNNRYLIYTSTMLVSGTTVNTPNGTCELDTLPDENDVFRNCALTFASDPPPIIDQNDVFPIVVSAGMFLRRSVITSSMTAFTNWSTPDLTFSNVSSSKVLQDLLNLDQKYLDDFFKRRLGIPVKSTFPTAIEIDIIRLSELSYVVPETTFLP